jgi:glycine dehydrogenase subunit 1
MLDAVGVAEMADLFAAIPPNSRPSISTCPRAARKWMCGRPWNVWPAKTRPTWSASSARILRPLCAGRSDLLLARGEFATAYTPYQPEASQGTLQAIFEFQTAVCRLLDMEVANAGGYDGGTVLFESLMMAVRHTRRKKAVVSEAVNPIYRIVLATYTKNLHLELVTVPHTKRPGRPGGAHGGHRRGHGRGRRAESELFRRGCRIHRTFRHRRRQGRPVDHLLLSGAADRAQDPGRHGRGHRLCEGQSLGLPLSFGGPYLGIMTCRKALVRQMPGRIADGPRTARDAPGTCSPCKPASSTSDARRPPPTSAPHQALCALRALINLCLLGNEGLSRQAAISIENANYAAYKLQSIPGVRLLSDAPFGNEFAAVFPINAKEVARRLMDGGIIPGFPLGRYYMGLENALLVCCTEKHHRDDIDRLARRLERIL